MRCVTGCTFWSSGEKALGQVQPWKQGEDGSSFGTTSPTAKVTPADHSLGAHIRDHERSWEFLSC